MFWDALVLARMDGTDEEVGLLLRTAREAAHLTVNELAFHLKLDRSMVSRWETGEKPFQLRYTFRLPPEMQRTLGELIGPEWNVLVVPGDAVTFLARLIHARPRPMRARFSGAGAATQEQRSVA